ncbi:MAG: transposon-encoded TnpW family protein [Oscillospiraceae bacterium]|jgi:hypothetical protein|nr:transposon-encoded TnpW family protein [Oscillospiraceae bacterium]
MTTTTTAAVKAASAAKTARIAEREPIKFVKRIGSTNYIISARFNATATETVEDKILRLIEREVSSQC